VTYVVYSAAPEIPEPPLPKFLGLSHTWTGWDGTTFDLTEGTAGVFMLLDGVTGMHMPEFDQFLDEHASVDGARYRGERTRVRNPEWTLGIFGDTSPEWRARDVAFWRTMHPGRPGLWTVTDPDGATRTLACRYRSSSEIQFDLDPSKAGWSVYPVTLMAERPYWEGAPINSPVWGEAESEDFTGPDDEAPDYYVAGATSLGSAAMANPGDVDASLVYTVRGVGAGLTSVSIEAAGGELGFGAVAAGSVLRINTDPTAPLATLDGVDVSGSVDPWDPRAIPAGESSALGITMVGEGTVQASFVPRYFRAL
jgi:hypothetical protein